MNFILIADTYFPSKTSGAVQLYDLAREFSRQGDSITVLTPDPSIESPWEIDGSDEITVLRIRTPNIKSPVYWRRALAELLMPLYMIVNLIRSPISISKWDGIIWYSPSIFFGPLIHFLKFKNSCRTYLIIRDIFPEWALDMSLIKDGFSYRLLRLIANYQYLLADTIGIQAEGNRKYFQGFPQNHPNISIDVLHNWLYSRPLASCSINLHQDLRGSPYIFVYIGNMGVAQDAGIFLNLAQQFSADKNYAFVFVGRGSEVPALKMQARNSCLTNVHFYDEVESDEIPGLLNQCHVGLVSLALNHKSHNIPGKFLSYLVAGMPVLIRVNDGNDLEEFVREHDLGVIIKDDSPNLMASSARTIALKVVADKGLKLRCKNLADQFFSPQKAVIKIKSSLLI